MLNSFPMKNILCEDKFERNAKWLEDQLTKIIICNQIIDQNYKN